jgi:hypothetical protein
MTANVNLVAKMKNGNPVEESVLVETLGPNRFRLVRSPGLVPGLAAGDEFELAAAEAHGYRLLIRGGNVVCRCSSRMQPMIPLVPWCQWHNELVGS